MAKKPTRAETKKTSKPPEPVQVCKFCGQTMSLTPISSMRYQEADGPQALKSRGFFYACICTPHELQPAGWARFTLDRPDHLL